MEQKFKFACLVQVLLTEAAQSVALSLDGNIYLKSYWQCKNLTQVAQLEPQSTILLL